MNFTITEEQHKQISEFQRKVESERNTSQQGAIGGATTYSFTPTTLGVIFKVTHFDKELDLTNYKDW